MIARHIMRSALPVSDGVQHPQANTRKSTAKIALGLSIVFVIIYVPYRILWAYIIITDFSIENATLFTISVSVCLLHLIPVSIL
jgi:hypothetical protein